MSASSKGMCDIAGKAADIGALGHGGFQRDAVHHFQRRARIVGVGPPAGRREDRVDFGALPPGKPRLRQFVVPDLQCEALGQILVNGASTCEAEAPGACMDGLTVTSRTGVEMLG